MFEHYARINVNMSKLDAYVNDTLHGFHNIPCDKGKSIDFLNNQIIDPKSK